MAIKLKGNETRPGALLNGVAAECAIMEDAVELNAPIYIIFFLSVFASENIVLLFKDVSCLLVNLEFRQDSNMISYAGDPGHIGNMDYSRASWGTTSLELTRYLSRSVEYRWSPRGAPCSRKLALSSDESCK